MSADIIAFPFKAVATGLDQQRWIPAPRPRRSAPRARAAQGWLRFTGAVMLALSSWGILIGVARLVGSVI